MRGEPPGVNTSTASPATLEQGPDQALATSLESSLESSRDNAAGRIDRDQLKGATVSGLGVNMVAQVLRFGLQFAYQIVMARILAPRDFGLVALVAPIISFVGLFADLGLSQATVQRDQISQAQLSFLFWINVAAGAALALATFALAPVVGWFYGDPRVIAITMASGSLFLLGGFYTQHLALLNRRMRFGALVGADLSSYVIGGAVGIAAALWGAGYWAIVANSAATSMSSMVLAWTLARWRPSRPSRPDEAGALLRFGADLTGFNLVNYFARNLDNVLIGRFDGELSLGFYDRAYKLLLLPLMQISAPLSRVAVPLLSRTQSEPRVYRRAYLRTLELTLMLTYPGVLFAMVTSDRLIPFVLGAKWAGVAPIFFILAIGGLIAAVSNSTGWLFISQGRTRDMRNVGIVSSLLYVGSFIAGLPWGPTGVAAAYVAMQFARIPFVWRAATRTGPVVATDIFGALGPSVAAGLITVALLYATDRFVSPGLMGLAAQFVGAHISFFTVLLLIPRSRMAMLDIFSEARQSALGRRLVTGWRRLPV